MVMHKLPGRIRVKLPAIRRKEHMAARLKSLLRRQQGVQEVAANADSASVTIYFHTEVFDPEQWLDHLRLDRLRRQGRNKLPDRKKKLPWPLSVFRRATFAFGELLPAKAQFALATAALIASIVELPAIVTQCILSAALMPIANRC